MSLFRSWSWDFLSYRSFLLTFVHYWQGNNLLFDVSILLKLLCVPNKMINQLLT